MNTIRRPRKRPRKGSISFRTFGWVLAREAFMRVTEHIYPSPISEELRRRALCDRPSWWVREVAHSFIRQNPARRIRP